MPVQFATFSVLDISNGGQSAIGEQTEHWTLQITGPKESALVLLDASSIGNTRTVLSPLDSPAKNAIALRIGLMDSRAAIQLRLLVLNTNGRVEQVLDPVSTLKGLPKPLLTTQSSDRRIAVKLLSLVWPGVGIIVVLGALIDYLRQRQKNSQWSWKGQMLYFVREIPSLFIASTLVAGLVALGFGWGLAGLVRLSDLF
jgi:hypothetical protein